LHVGGEGEQSVEVGELEDAVDRENASAGEEAQERMFDSLGSTGKGAEKIGEEGEREEERTTIKETFGRSFCMKDEIDDDCKSEEDEGEIEGGERREG